MQDSAVRRRGEHRQDCIFPLDQATRAQVSLYAGSLATLEQHGIAKLLQVKQAKRALAVKVDNPKIVRFMQILHGYLEMAGIPLLHQLYRQLICDELLDSLRPKLFKKRWMGERRVGGCDYKRAATGEQQRRFHTTSPERK